MGVAAEIGGWIGSQAHGARRESDCDRFLKEIQRNRSNYGNHDSRDAGENKATHADSPLGSVDNLSNFGDRGYPIL
jgi:hypothetical protein